MRVKVIINPAAGKAEPVLSVLNDVFSAADIEWDVAITHGAGDATVAARQAAGEGFDLIGAYGGDGTVAEVAAALADGGPPILLLPGGTGNALAEDLGIPPILVDAASLIVGDAYEIRRVDMGRAGERWFVLRLTMGFEAEMVAAATREMKDRYGWLAYAIKGLQTLTDAPLAAYTITADGETINCTGIAALIANSASTGVPGVRIADDIIVSDGILDVVVAEPTTLLGLLGNAADMAQGQPARALSRWRGTTIRIESKPVQTVLADGEDAGHTPVDVTIVPGAVGIVVPKATGRL